MKMVGHEAVAKDWHGDFDTGVVEGLEEGVVITLLVKNLPAPIAAVYHMVANAANRGSRAAGHIVNVGNILANGNNKRARPEWHEVKMQAFCVPTLYVVRAAVSS